MELIGPGKHPLVGRPDIGVREHPVLKNTFSKKSSIKRSISMACIPIDDVSMNCRPPPPETAFRSLWGTVLLLRRTIEEPID